MTNQLDPPSFRPDAVAPEICAVNASLVKLMTAAPDWWVTGAEAARVARRRGEGPFPALVVSRVRLYTTLLARRK